MKRKERQEGVYDSHGLSYQPLPPINVNLTEPDTHTVLLGEHYCAVFPNAVFCFIIFRAGKAPQHSF